MSVTGSARVDESTNGLKEAVQNVAVRSQSPSTPDVDGVEGINLDVQDLADYPGTEDSDQDSERDEQRAEEQGREPSEVAEHELEPGRSLVQSPISNGFLGDALATRSSHGDGLSDLSTQAANDLIRGGAVSFKGFCEGIQHAPSHRRLFFASAFDERDILDRPNPKHGEVFSDISMPVVWPEPALVPWETLEHPSMAFCFGREPGTVMLAYWVARSGSLDVKVQITSDMEPRKISLLSILERLRHLEKPLEQDCTLRQDYLYSYLLPDSRDSEALDGSGRGELSDLITVLSRPDWIDFSKQENQVVAEYFTSADSTVHQQFFHQLLLSVELYKRFEELDGSDIFKKKLLPLLPPQISWTLAMAQRWVSSMSIQKPKRGSKKSSISFDLVRKDRQVELLRHFAWTLKWPNMSEVEYVLNEDDPMETPLEERSAVSMSWYTGVVLPGKTLPWLVMKALIDCDRDTKDTMRSLTSYEPHSGLQYKTNSYWSWECVVGKVLAAASGVEQIAGWIGPCHYSVDLKRREAIRVNQVLSEQQLSASNVEKMHVRSDARGPSSRFYSYEDYKHVELGRDDPVDGIRIEKLMFTAVKERKSTGRKPSLKSSQPLLYDAAISFAIDGISQPINLIHDVWFVTAHPCRRGPHVLCTDYDYVIVRIDELVGYHGVKGDQERFAIERHDKSSDQHGRSDGDPGGAIVLYDEEKTTMLVVEAFGVCDNGVLARAWCSQWGQSALTCDVRKTCAACAIREAYAAGVVVIILTDGRNNDYVEKVERKTDRD